MARINKKRSRNPLILIGCEGKNESERLYFSHFSSRDCRILFSTGNNTDPKGMFNDLKKYMQKEDINSSYGDEIYLVLDTDLDARRIKDIKEIENDCLNLGITIITSSPTFEIWYLMHMRNNNLFFTSSKDVKSELKRLINNYKESMDIYPLICANTKGAIKLAKDIEKNHIRNGEKDDYYFNPHSKVYLILEELEKIKNNNQ